MELTTSIENELEALKLKGLKFNGVDKFKFIGRVTDSTQPEWQKILYLDNEVSSNFRQSPNSDSTSTEIKHGSSKDFESVKKGKIYTEFQDKALVTLSRFWKWYISGFVSRPDKAMYESPRFYRIVLTFLFFSGFNPLTLILLPFLPKDTVSSSSTSSPVLSSSDTEISKIRGMDSVTYLNRCLDKTTIKSDFCSFGYGIANIHGGNKHQEVVNLINSFHASGRSMYISLELENDLLQEANRYGVH